MNNSSSGTGFHQFSASFTSLKSSILDRRKQSLLAIRVAPNSISVAAAEQRVISADMAGVLEAAADPAVAAGAENSLEKMLCHQLPALHRAAMQLFGRGCGNLPPPDKARLANAGARLIEVYHAGLLTLQKLKSVALLYSLAI
jgi:hypothetical protein